MNALKPVKINLRITLACTLCLLAGCATVRQARTIQKGAFSRPGERLLTAVEVGLSSTSGLTLDRAMEIALSSHPSVFAAEQALVAATAQVYQARAAFWPQLSAGASESRSTSNSEGTPESHSTRKSFSGSIGLDLLVYDFGKTPAVVRQAYARQIAASENLRSARSDLAYVVRIAFYNLGKAEELIQVATDAVRQYKSRLDQVQAFQEVGRRTRYDLTKSEVDLGNAKLTLIKAKNDESDARTALNLSLGLAEDPGYTVLSSNPPPFAMTSAAELMKRARQNHPGLLALQAQERAANAAVDEAIASLYPEIGLQAKYGLSGGHFPLTWNWSAMLQSAMQLFTGHRQTWNIQGAAAQLREARSQVTTRELQIYKDLQNALNQLDSAQQRLPLTDLLVRQAQETLDLVNERYQIGSASAVDVTDAQVALTGARAEQVKAKFDNQTAIAQIRHAAGEE